MLHLYGAEEDEEEFDGEEDEDEEDGVYWWSDLQKLAWLFMGNIGICLK